MLFRLTTDLDRNPRFIDHPGIADTGVGGSPVVDRGAFENQVDICLFKGDMDNDCDVGLKDFALWQRSITGPSAKKVFQQPGRDFAAADDRSPFPRAVQVRRTARHDPSHRLRRD